MMTQEQQGDEAMANEWLQLCDEIDDGMFDDGLEEIARAVQSRRDVVHRRLARRLQRELAVGDRVMLTNGIKPRYLEGMSATVIRLQLDQQAAVVDLDALPTPGRGRPSNEAPRKKMLVPLINLVKIDADVETLGSTDDSADIGDDTEDYDEEDDD